MLKAYSTLFAVVCTVLVSVVILGAIPTHVIAMNTDAMTSFTGTVQDVPADTYDVYVRLAQRGQTAQVAVEVQNGQVGRYTAIGPLIATSNSWQKVGTWQALQSRDKVSFRLNSGQLSNIVNANRPTLMLISHTHPVCAPNPECTVMVDDRVGTILPSGNSALRDTLRISRVVSPTSDTVSQVTYYLDDKPVYSTKTYQPLDLRYVLHDEQKAVSVIEYASGQRIMIHETIPRGYADTFWNFLFRGFHRNAQLNAALLVTVGVVILLFVTLGVVRILERRRAWRIAHGFIVVKQRVTSEAERRRSRIGMAIRVWLRRILAVCLVVLAGYGLLAATGTYLVTIARVNGVSMERTYTDGSALLVNRVPITLAQLAGRSYVPVRGQAVILHAVYGVADTQTKSEDGQEYIVKRVLGLPGERVVVDGGVVSVYKPDGTVIHPDKDAVWSDTMYATVDKDRIDLTLGSDEVFVAGDNRPLSMDSRINGAISTSQITGVVVTKLW